MSHHVAIFIRSVGRTWTLPTNLFHLPLNATPRNHNRTITISQQLLLSVCLDISYLPSTPCPSVNPLILIYSRWGETEFSLPQMVVYPDGHRGAFLHLVESTRPNHRGIGIGTQNTKLIYIPRHVSMNWGRCGSTSKSQTPIYPTKKNVQQIIWGNCFHFSVNTLRPKSSHVTHTHRAAHTRREVVTRVQTHRVRDCLGLGRGWSQCAGRMDTQNSPSGYFKMVMGTRKILMCGCRKARCAQPNGETGGPHVTLWHTQKTWMVCNSQERGTSI